MKAIIRLCYRERGEFSVFFLLFMFMNDPPTLLGVKRRRIDGQTPYNTRDGRKWSSGEIM